MRAIIDGDSISYIIAYGHQSTSVDNPNLVVESVKQMVDSMLDAVGATEYMGFIEDSGYTFRHLATVAGLFDGAQSDRGYKANRGAKRSEWHMNWGATVNSYLRHNYGFTTIRGIESDDAVSIAAMEAKNENIDYCICGNDKDLYQVPGKHYNYKTQKQLDISVEQAEFLKYKQVLMGDSTDNIQGIPKVGPKTAEKMLEPGSDYTFYKYIALQEYIKYYGQREGILKFAENCNLIMLLENRLQLPKDYNYEGVFRINKRIGSDIDF